MSDRGMKKWAPYRALVEQLPALEKMERKTKVISKPIILEDKQEEINEILMNYHHQVLKITFYKQGFIYEVRDTIKKIDTYEKKLVLSQGKIIKLFDLIDLSNNR